METKISNHHCPFLLPASSQSCMQPKNSRPEATALGQGWRVLLVLGERSFPCSSLTSVAGSSSKGSPSSSLPPSLCSSLGSSLGCTVCSRLFSRGVGELLLILLSSSAVMGKGWGRAAEENEAGWYFP